MPLIAASTCSHSAGVAADRRRSSGVGSNAIDDVVPWVAHTKNGTSPAARSASITAASASGRMANALVVGDDAQPVGADAGDAQALLDARVGLRGGVGDEPRRVAVVR